MFKSTRTEIARNQWRSFCDGYSRQHQGWIVKVNIYDPSMSKLSYYNPTSRFKTMANDLAFRGIVFEDFGPRPELLVNLGSGTELITHRLMQPTHIVEVETVNGLHEGLLIHDRNGGVMQIRFREPANPEMLDGWVALETASQSRPPWLPNGAF